MGASTNRFNFKFSPSNPRDMQLRAWIEADVKSGSVNISEVIKSLLWEWYRLRRLLGRLPQPMVVDLLETPAIGIPMAVSNGNGHYASLPSAAPEPEPEPEPLCEMCEEVPPAPGKRFCQACDEVAHKLANISDVFAGIG